MAYTPLSATTIKRGLQTQIIGRDIVCVKTVGSTNDWLKTAAAEGAEEGLVVFAEEQTAGRGQAGHTWLAPPGCCLLVSVLLRPSLPPDRLFLFTMIGACAAAGASIDISGRSILLKWPNDILSPEGKIGGVLTESSIVHGRVDYVILGVGLNVNISRRALAEIPGAASLQAGLGHPVNRATLARVFLQGLDDRYATIRSHQDEAIVTEWKERLATIGQWVNLRIGDRVEGPLFALQVTDEGGLVLLRPDGSTFTVLAGEVSVRPAPATDLPADR